MRPKNSTQRWFAAAVCVLATAGFAAAEEGVVRISDAKTRPGVVRMNAGQQSKIQQTAYGTAGHSNLGFAQQNAGFAAAGQRYPARFASAQGAVGVDPYVAAAYGQNSFGASPAYQPMALTSCECGCGGDGVGCGCGPEGCNNGSCRTGRNRNGQCDGDSNFRSGRDTKKMRRKGDMCDSDVCYGDEYNQRMWTLFARACPKDGCTCWPTRWWRGQQLNYLARNQRLSNTLFGWMVPSGCCGQGCPPFGCYNVTYADDPGYTDGRDGGAAYGAQGYGVPVSVPLAPNVRQSYNYSWGTPSSRITPMGQYSAGAAQQSPHQSW